MPQRHRILQLLEGQHAALAEAWLAEFQGERDYREDVLPAGELREQCLHVLQLLQRVLAQEAAEEGIHTAPWNPVRDYLADLMQQWLDAGFRTADVAAFLLLLKRPLIARLAEQAAAPSEVVADVRTITDWLDRLVLWLSERFQQRLQDMIRRQHDELLELSTPVVSLWKGILALPLIGTLDSARTQTVMESLLQRIVETGADVAILDITGVPTVDTMVAQHLLKTVTAARLMGASCIISGIRPSIAQTMVQLGIDLRDVVTKATLADAFAMALADRGQGIQPARAKPEGA